MSDLVTKKEKLKNAVQRLDEAVEYYKESPNDIKRDGAIQRFEFCAELSWKTIRLYLIDQGFLDVKGPKSVLREAYSYDIIDDEDVWIAILDDRNLTSHVYDEKTADEIFQRIKNEYLPVFKKLSEFLSEE